MECAATDRHDNWRCCAHRTLSPSGRRTTGFEELTLPEISTGTIRTSSEDKRNIIFHLCSCKTSGHHLPVIHPQPEYNGWFRCLYDKKREYVSCPVSIKIKRTQKRISIYIHIHVSISILNRDVRFFSSNLHPHLKSRL